MLRALRLWPIVVLAAIASCHRSPKGTSAPPEPVRPLAAYSTERLIVAPTAGIRAEYDLMWGQQLGGVFTTGHRLDTNIVKAFEARGLTSQWIWPADLMRSYQGNRTYAVHPYRLAVTPLKASKFAAGEKFGEPLSSQLRTMIALHEDARLVLIPVELRFEREGKTGNLGRAILRTVLLDPRYAEARFVSDVKSDISSTATQALASVASRLADLFATP